MARRGRRVAAPLVNPRTDPRTTVGLSVAAAYLKVHERTLRARIESGAVTAERDGKVYIIATAEIVRYETARSVAS